MTTWAVRRRVGPVRAPAGVGEEIRRPNGTGRPGSSPAVIGVAWIAAVALALLIVVAAAVLLLPHARIGRTDIPAAEQPGSSPAPGPPPRAICHRRARGDAIANTNVPC